MRTDEHTLPPPALPRAPAVAAPFLTRAAYAALASRVKLFVGLLASALVGARWPGPAVGLLIAGDADCRDACCG